MKFEFNYFIPDCRYLSARAVREAGFSSMVFPEMPSGQELLELGVKTGAKSGIVYAYEFSKAAASRSGSVSELIAYYNENSYTNCMILFDNNISIWIPEDHKFFVVFGSSITEKIDILKGIFEYEFSEYLEENFQSPGDKETLKRLRSEYHFDTS